MLVQNNRDMTFILLVPCRLQQMTSEETVLREVKTMTLLYSIILSSWIVANFALHGFGTKSLFSLFPSKNPKKFGGCESPICLNDTDGCSCCLKLMRHELRQYNHSQAGTVPDRKPFTFAVWHFRSLLGCEDYQHISDAGDIMEDVLVALLSVEQSLCIGIAHLCGEFWNNMITSWWEFGHANNWLASAVGIGRTRSAAAHTFQTTNMCESSIDFSGIGLDYQIASQNFSFHSGCINETTSLCGIVDSTAIEQFCNLGSPAPFWDTTKNSNFSVMAYIIKSSVNHLGMTYQPVENSYVWRDWTIADWSLGLRLSLDIPAYAIDPGTFVISITVPSWLKVR